LGAAAFLVFDAFVFVAAMPARGAGRGTGLPCHAWAGRVFNSVYFRLGRCHDAGLAFLAVPDRQCLIRPGHVGLARPVARQSIDINDAG
jgi:hypothetical protein